MISKEVESILEPIPISKPDDIELNRESGFALPAELTPNYPLKRIFEVWKSRLGDSHYAEDQFLAFIFSENDENREYHLLQAYGLNPNDILINQAVFRYCKAHEASQLCNLPVADFLKEHEGDNPHYYIEQAAYALKRGEEDLAKHLLAEAQYFDRSDFYEWRYIDLVDGSLSRFGVSRGYWSLIETAGIVSAMQWPGYMGTLLNDMCGTQRLTESESWRDTCFGALQSIELNDKSFLLASSARNIINTRFDSRPSNQYLHDTNSNYEDLTNEVGEFSLRLHNRIIEEVGASGLSREETLSRVANMDIPISDRVWSEYVRLYRESGQFAAQAWLLQELMEADVRINPASHE